MIRAFAFDLDETLVDCETHHDEATAKMLQATGASLHVVREVFAECTGKRTRDLVEAFRVAAGVPHALDDLLALRTQAFRDAVLRAPPVFLPGARDLLHQARALGPVALVTSGHHGDALATLEVLGARPFFDVVVTGEDVDRPKPDPEPYLSAARRLGVAPQEMLAFEDSARGVAAAKAAGCLVVAVPHARNTPRHAVSEADAVLGSLEEALPLADLLEKLRCPR